MTQKEFGVFLPVALREKRASAFAMGLKLAT